METPPKLPNLTAQEKLDAIYEFKLRLFQGLVECNPNLINDPNVIEVVNNEPQS